MKKTRKSYWIRPIVVFSLVFIILSGVYMLFSHQTIEQNKERAMAVGISEMSTIRDRFDVIFARDYTMRNLIISDQGSIEGLDTVADDIVKETGTLSGITIKNIAVAPGGVVEKVYPLDGNEGLIGFDFLDAEKEGNTEAIEAYEKGKLVVTNPFSLVQGGIGMGGRLPVFLGEGENKQFWGIVTITLDYTELLEALNLDSLVQSGYYYHLWYADENGDKVTVAESASVPQHPVTQSFTISNLKWNLDLAPVKGWRDPVEVILYFVAILIFAVLMAAIQVDKINIQAVNAKLERLARLDALTACYSRQYVNTVLVNQQSGKWHDPEVKYSMVLLDIDQFKQFNDTYGHETGDRVIVAVAQVLMDHCQSVSGDCVIRYGGDEFVILYNDITRNRLEDKLKDILVQVQQIHFEEFPDIHVTVSMGAEGYVSAEQSYYYDLLRAADEKLYQAKEQGRNQYCL